MKKTITTLCALVFSMVSCSNVFGADWQKIVDDAFFDASHIEKTKQGTVLVWIKETKNKSYIKRIQNISGKDYSLYKNSISIFEFDCKNRKMTLLDIYDYNNKGTLIHSAENTKIVIDHPVHESVGDLYLDRVCGHVKANSRR